MAVGAFGRVMQDLRDLDPEELREVSEAAHRLLLASHAAGTRVFPTPADLAAAGAMLEATIVDGLNGGSPANEAIDADLAAHYVGH